MGSSDAAQWVETQLALGLAVTASVGGRACGYWLHAIWVPLRCVLMWLLRRL